MLLYQIMGKKKTACGILSLLKRRSKLALSMHCDAVAEFQGDSGAIPGRFSNMFLVCYASIDRL